MYFFIYIRNLSKYNVKKLTDEFDRYTACTERGENIHFFHSRDILPNAYL